MKLTSLNIGNLGTASHRISEAVTEFINNKSRFVQEDKQCFTATDLRQYVQLRVGGYVAPSSPDRILRNLRKKGKVNYTLINRSRSLYRAVPALISIPDATGDSERNY
jgi:hypothetical protein